MTNQEAIERVSEHLMKQGEIAVTATGRCMYRHKQMDGLILRCAIGGLIPEGLADEIIEGQSIGGLCAGSKKLSKLFEGLDFELLRQLQNIHDSFRPQIDGNFRDFLRREIPNAEEVKKLNLKTPACLLA